MNRSLEAWLVRLAVFATFCLLIVGGTVNPTGSSLACPEPTLVCHGQLFPKLTGGVLYEHGHRLLAMSVGLLQIALTLVLWVRRPRFRRAAVAALLLVCAQGALGAVTVYLKLPWVVSTAHLLLGFSYLALLLYLAEQLRPEHVPRLGDTETARRIRPVVFLAAVLLLMQVILGGLVRHNEAALASIDLVPFVNDALWARATPIALRLHLAHRVGGILVGTVLAFAGAWVAWQAQNWPRIRSRAALVPVIVVLQIILGAWVIISLRQVPVAVAHFAGAVTLWGLVCSLWWQLKRMCR